MAKVSIVMGSDSDMPIMAQAADILEEAKNELSFDLKLSRAQWEAKIYNEQQKNQQMQEKYQQELELEPER